MRSILEEIGKLRNVVSYPLHIDRTNQNPYRLVLHEEDGTRTAYYFSVPIYNQQTRRLLRPCFTNDQGSYSHHGCSAKISAKENVIYMRNTDGECQLLFDGSPFRETTGELDNGSFRISGTLNGIACKGRKNEEMSVKFILHTDSLVLSVRANDRCFSLMSSEFRPFVTVSGIAALDSFGQIAAPLRVHYQRLTDYDYALELFADSPYSHTAFFEVNMYAAKLFQDTTVDSQKADTNNAFGGTAYIGNSATYGEEWLYTRPDHSRLEDLLGRELRQAVFHIPSWAHRTVEMSAFSVVSRFCSFGSTWNNKVPESYKIGDTVVANGYHHLDVSGHFIEQNSRFLRHHEGMILRSKVKGTGYTAISTGDSYFAPQILEVRFR